MKKKIKDEKVLSAFEQLKTLKHKEFVLEYIEMRNATKAYQKVYKTKNYSAAMVDGCKLVRNGKIKAAIDEKFAEKWAEKQKDVGLVYNELLKIATSDVSDLLNFDKNKIEFNDFKNIDTKTIKNIEITEQKDKDKDESEKIITKIQLHDKVKALSELTKMLGIIQNKVTVHVNYDKESAEKIQELFGESETSEENN
jgi:phage terminase small subunit